MNFLVVWARAAAASGSEVEEGAGGESGMLKSGCVGRVRLWMSWRSEVYGEGGAEAGVVAVEGFAGGIEGPGAGLSVRRGSWSSARG